MNRSWITALTLATVAGSGGAFAGIVAGNTDTPAVAQQPTANQGMFLRTESPATPGRTLSYQVGAAGTATLTIGNGSLVIDNAVADTGWTVTSASGAGTHVDAQFTDGTQLVTFAADLVGTDVVVVSLSNVPAAAPATTVPAESISVEVATNTARAHATTTSQPQPATPPATAAPAAVQPPTTSATTAPSGSGATNDDGDNEHEEESNDD